MNSLACFILALLYISKCYAQPQVFNILQFGAVGTGTVDSKQALLNAWSQACAWRGSSMVLIPQGNFLILPLTDLRGPCNGFIQIQLDGNLVASSDRAFAGGEYWIKIEQVNNLLIDGLGTLDGQGPSAWPLATCTSGEQCPSFPVTLKISKVSSVTVRNIRSVNSKFFHFAVLNSQIVTFDHVTITAPGDSPNTDGIHVGDSSGVNIINANIGTGDDCISLGPGSTNINITGVQCGPGHGISIGSLGKNQNEAPVTGVTVQNSVFSGTSNGVRIKSWSTPNQGLVSDITYRHLRMKNVQNPIVIDQNYCPHVICQKGTSQSRVQIRGVNYEDIRGSSNTEVAVNFDCSQVNECVGIVIRDIHLPLYGATRLGRSRITSSACFNVRGSVFGQQLPPPCLSS